MFCIFLRSHGALRNFTSPGQLLVIAAECEGALELWSAIYGSSIIKIGSAWKYHPFTIFFCRLKRASILEIGGNFITKSIRPQSRGRLLIAPLQVVFSDQWHGASTWRLAAGQVLFISLDGEHVSSITISLGGSTSSASNSSRISYYLLAERQPVGRWVELKQEPVSPSSD